MSIIDKNKLCKCGRLWNQECAMDAYFPGRYQSKYTPDELMNPNHPSGFFYMTGAERRAFSTSPESMVECKGLHGLRLSPNELDELKQESQQPPPLPSAPRFSSLNIKLK